METSKILKECDERRELKKRRFDGLQQLERYKCATWQLKKSLSEAKNDWVEQQAIEIAQEIATSNTRKANNIVKRLSQDRNAKTNAIKDKI